MVFQAPRNLNAPMRWRFSHFRYTSAPTRASSVADVATGVRCATDSTRARAEISRATISSCVGIAAGSVVTGMGATRLPAGRGRRIELVELGIAVEQGKVGIAARPVRLAEPGLPGLANGVQRLRLLLQ